MTKETNNKWVEISTKLNYLPIGSLRRKDLLENNLDTIKNLKAEEIDRPEVQPSSVILGISKSSPKKLEQVLDSWKENKELNEIFYRVAGEGNPQSIANTLTGLSNVNNKEYLNSFYDALEGSARTDDFIQNANKEELYNSRKALSKSDRDDVKQAAQTIRAKEAGINGMEISQLKEKWNAATTIQSATRQSQAKKYTDLVRKSCKELNSIGETLIIPQSGIEKRAFYHAVDLVNSQRANEEKNQTYAISR